MLQKLTMNIILIMDHGKVVSMIVMLKSHPKNLHALWFNLK